MSYERLDALEAERRGETFRVELGDGEVLRTVDPRALAWPLLCRPAHELIGDLIDPRDRGGLARLVTEDVDPIVDAYRAHYGLGSLAEAAELVWVLDRCADEVTYDLITRGLDLGELWRERRWHLLWTTLIYLPRNSATKEKLVLDEEFAERVLRREEARGADAEAKAISMRDYSPEVEALYAVIDRLGDVISGLVGLSGGKPKRVKPMPRPETAFMRVKRRKRLEAHRSLAARVLPSAREDRPQLPSA